MCSKKEDVGDMDISKMGIKQLKACVRQRHGAAALSKCVTKNDLIALCRKKGDEIARKAAAAVEEEGGKEKETTKQGTATFKEEISAECSNCGKEGLKLKNCKGCLIVKYVSESRAKQASETTRDRPHGRAPRRAS